MYGKFFRSAFSGSMMASGADVFAVWAYVIAHADKGRVELNPRMLAAVIGADESRMRLAVEKLCSPDPASRSKDHDGRRLVREGEYQFFVVNHAHYRSIRNEEERREYNREAKRRERKKSKEKSLSVNDIQRQSSVSAHTEAEAEAEAVSNPSGSLAPGSSPRPRKTAAKKSSEPAPTAATWEAYSGAYRHRYGAEPVRNARVNGQLAQVVARLGAEEAPAVAAHYLKLGAYASTMHPVNLLLRDLEGLRTQWFTGRQAPQRGTQSASQERKDRMSELMFTTPATNGATPPGEVIDMPTGGRDVATR